MLKREQLSRTYKRLGRQVRRRWFSNWGLPSLHGLLEQDQDMWSGAIEASKGGPKVLIATSTAGHRAVLPVEFLLGAALTLRGAEVHYLLCDISLPACLLSTSDEYWSIRTFAKQGPKHICQECFHPGRQALSELGLPIHYYSDWLKDEQKETIKGVANKIPVRQIESYTQDSMAIGEHAHAGALRFFAVGDLEGEQYADLIARRYFESALLTQIVLQNLLDAHHFNIACFHHGIYVPQGVVGEVCRKRGVRVVNWNPAYRKKCFIFSHGDTYHHTLMDEPISVWEDLSLTSEMDSSLDQYLRSRWYGTQDWIWFHEEPDFDYKAFHSEYGIDPSKPMIGLLTNVIWDAQLHYPANAFSSMTEWVIETIHYFSRRDDLQLVIRVHPAEIRGTLRSRQPIVTEIHNEFPELPSNVKVIPPDSRLSTYTVMEQCDSIIIFGTKTGVELTAMGIPVVVAGEAWIRNKGLTTDVSSREDYLQILDDLPLGHRLSQKQVERARKYAYHFFFRRMIPIECMEPKTGWPPYLLKIMSLNDLMPGEIPGLDLICEGILKGTAFVYPAEHSQ